MQQRVSDQPAFILHRRDFRDSSLILEVFTEQFGRLGLIAKGARKRRDAAHFQPFNRLMIDWSGRGELKTLTRIDSKPMGVDTQCYLPVFYINELLLYMLPRQDEHRQHFDAYMALLSQIRPHNFEPLLRTFEVQLLTELGLVPDLLCRSDTGSKLEENRYYRLHMEAGILPARQDDQLTYRGSELKAIHQRDFETPNNLRAARLFLRQIIDYNLQGRTLQSRKLYQQLKTRS